MSYRYRMHTFLVTSDCLLKPLSIQKYEENSELNKVNTDSFHNAKKHPTFRLSYVGSEADDLSRLSISDFPRYLSRLPNGFLRSYVTEQGVLLCAGRDRLFMIGPTGETVFYTEEKTDPLNKAITTLCLTGTVLSACALLQGCLPLHAACIDMKASPTDVMGCSNGTRRIAFMAASGTGKSTLLWHCLDRGADFVSDDVTMMVEYNGSMLASPSHFLNSKLKWDAIKLRECSERLRPIFPGANKYYFPISKESCAQETRPLDALFILRPDIGMANQPHLANKATASYRRLEGSNAIAELFAHIHALWAVAPFMQKSVMLKQMSLLASSTPIFTLSYPRSFAILPVVARIMRLLSTVGDGS